MGLVENLIDKLGINNIIIIPKNINTYSIIELTDICMTVCGTCGLEMGCYGKPTINAGNSLYSGYGFNYEPKTREDYIELIRNIDQISKLNSKQIRAAKIVAYQIFINDQHYPNFLFKNYSSEQDLESLFDNAILNYKLKNPEILAKKWEKVVTIN